MSRKEFLGQLERLLWDIPEQERKEALEYYQSYFEDAGEENESSVIQELGSPGKVAAIIKADLEDNREEHGEYTEAGYTDERFDERNMPKTKEQKAYDGPYKRAAYRSSSQSGRGPQKKGLSWILIILLLILTVPLWGGLAVGFLGLLVGLVAGVIGIVAALLFGGIGMVIAGVVLLIQTFVTLLASPATAMAVAGAALILLAFGLVFIVGFAWLALKVFPVCFRWFVDFVQRVLHRGITGGDRR